MVNILKEPIQDASAWNAKELAAEDSWICRLTPEDVQDVHDATATALAKCSSPYDIRQEDFQLPHLGPTLARLRDEVEYGRGFTVLRGLPVGDYTVEDNKFLYAGLITHLGTILVSHANGCLIDEVIDKGASYDKIEVRGYQTNAHLTPHCDSGDIVSLLCLRPAKEGGNSMIMSFTSVYNEILKSHPEYLPVLYRGFHYNIRGGGPPGPWQDMTRHRVPVYTYFQNRLSGRFNAKAIKTAQELPGCEPLTDLELAAIDYVADVAMRDEIRLEVTARSGDLQLLCNHTVMHNRSAFIDHEDPQRKRLMLRAWINIPNGRELPLEFDDHYNTGPRQGTYVHDPSLVST